jgi:hypothetical protein
MTCIECKVELRRTDGRVLSTSTSLRVRPIVDQLIRARRRRPMGESQDHVGEAAQRQEHIFELTAVEVSR